MVNVKRVLALILCAVMLFGVLPSSGFVMSASAEEMPDQETPQMETVSVLIYKNGDTSKAVKTESWKVPHGSTVELNINDYYSSSNGFVFSGWYNDGKWNQFKEGQNPTGLDSVSVSGWTNLYCMVTDYEKVVVKGVVGGDKDNAEEITSGSALHGSNLVEYLDNNVTIPDKTGYSVDKWYNWDWYGHKLDDEAIINGWTNVYVNYTANEYDVDFDAKGGTLPEGTDASKKVTFGGVYGTLPVPTLDGNIFVKWTLMDGTEVDENTTVATASNHTLCAVYEPEPEKLVKVTFDANGGTLNGSETEEVAVGTPVSDLHTTATRTGYKYEWYLDGKKADVVPDENCTLVAEWTARSIKVTLDANGGAFTDSTTTKEVKVTFDSPYGTKLTGNVPAKEGFVFSGWVLGEQKVSAEDPVVTAKAHTLVAQWIEAEPLTAKVVLKANGGAFSDGKVQKTVTVTVTGTYGNALLNNIPTLDAFIFDGWQDEDGNKVTENDIVATTEKHILYARWIPDGKTRIYWQFVDIGSGKVLIDGHTVWEATDRVGQTATFDLRKEDITDAENDAIEAALDGYRTANDETLERTVTLGAGEDVNTVQFRFRTIDTLPTIVYWTIENTDGDELRSGTEVLYFEDKDLGEEDLFYISNAGGIPAGYRLADDQENSEVITVGKENEVTFTVEASSRYTIVNWAFVNSDGDAVASGTWAEPLANRDDAGTRSSFYASTIEEYIPQYYTMSSWQRKYARITLGEENFVSFRVTLSSNYTIVHWSVVDADGEFVDGDTEIWDTLQNHSGTRYKFSLDTVFEMPKGYQIADGTNDYQFITMGKENYVEFKIEQAPQQTIIKWFFVDGNGNTIESGKVTRKATANIGKKGTFSVSETTGIPTGYRLADGESRTKDIIKGQTNKVYFKVCELITTGNNLFDNFVNFFYSFLYR